MVSYVTKSLFFRAHFSFKELEAVKGFLILANSVHQMFFFTTRKSVNYLAVLEIS